MSLYDYDCAHCGVVEVSQRMTDKPLTRCPECRGKVTRIFSTSVAFIGARDSNWESENGGRGRWISQIATSEHDTTAHCRSRAEAIEKAKRRGFTKIEKC